MTEKWLQILKRISQLQQEMTPNGSAPWFRGQRDSAWKIHSTLHRHVKRQIDESAVPFSDSARKSFLRDEYKSLYRRFLSDAWPLLDARERSDWGVVFSMQHYGLPTRLLDWTESFICALYFAHLNRQPQDEAAIFVLDPSKLNKLSVQREGLINLDDDPSPSIIKTNDWHPKYLTPDGDLSTIAVVPIYTNPRMIAQRAKFTISGDSFDPPEEHPALKDAIEKIVLPPDTFDDVEAYLELNGIDAFNFFPDHEGLKMKHEAATQKLLKDIKRFYPPKPSEQ
jgi:FRG domain-containing protein